MSFKSCLGLLLGEGVSATLLVVEAGRAEALAFLFDCGVAAFSATCEQMENCKNA